MISRRQFVLATAAGGACALAGIPRRAPAGSPQILRAAPAEAALAGPGAARTSVWAYDGAVPGDALRLKRGQAARIVFENALPEASTVHWHGLRIDNAMDGVPGLTQDPVAPDQRFAYTFTPPDAGTYWYHPHVRGWEQLSRGLSGPLIVEEDEPVAVDRDVTVVVDDWRLRQDGQIDTESFGAMSDRSHAGRLGNWLTLNGQQDFELGVRTGERIRLRLINTATDRVMAFDFPRHDVRIIALDGIPTSSHAPDGGRVVLAPAQRADLCLDCALAPGSVVEIGEVSTRSRITAGRLVYGDTPLRDAPPAETLQLPGAGLPEPRIAEARQIEMAMSGGAMGGMRSADYRGERMSIRDLVARGKVWAFNGTVGETGDRIAEIPRGQTAVINVVNDTAFDHAMHLHGHHTRVVARDGMSVPPEAWRDTVLVRRGERIGLGFVADNPGLWAFHCHMLSHAAAGMTGHIAVI